MSTQFDSAGSMLSGTVGKLNTMLKQNTGGYLLFLLHFYILYYKTITKHMILYVILCFHNFFTFFCD